MLGRHDHRPPRRRHVVSILALRGGEHHQALEGFEGVAADESNRCGQLGAITGQVAEAKRDAG